MKLKQYLSAAAMTIALSLNSQVAVSDIQVVANTGCFPRVFSQIDQFKVSSGGLRNTNSSPRNIICALHNDTTGSGLLGSTVFVAMESLPAVMECTAYARTVDTGALVDSTTALIPAGTSGEFIVGALDFAGNTDFDVFSYLQCKVPGDGRIFSVLAEYETI